MSDEAILRVSETMFAGFIEDIRELGEGRVLRTMIEVYGAGICSSVVKVLGSTVAEMKTRERQRKAATRRGKKAAA